MKTTSGWYNNGNGTNSSGFSGLPGGSRYYAGGFYFMYNDGIWWSATESGTTTAFTPQLEVETNYDYRYSLVKYRVLVFVA